MTSEETWNNIRFTLLIALIYTAAVCKALMIQSDVIIILLRNRMNACGYRWCDLRRRMINDGALRGVNNVCFSLSGRYFSEKIPCPYRLSSSSRILPKVILIASTSE